MQHSILAGSGMAEQVVQPLSVVLVHRDPLLKGKRDRKVRLRFHRNRHAGRIALTSEKHRRPSRSSPSSK